MLPHKPIRVLIAEDEILLANALATSLQKLWPQMELTGIAANGLETVAMALEALPDVMFLDIRMPGQSGLDAATALADIWPEERPFPLLVFVTAYDHYAIAAFEQAATDYLLKPVNEERLRKTMTRLQERIDRRDIAKQADQSTQQVLVQLRQLNEVIMPAALIAQPPLKMIRATQGKRIKLIPIEQVVYFSATDKYINVVTADDEVLIRSSLKELMARLDPDQFWQIHRSTIVRAGAILSAQRDETGKLLLNLHGRTEKLTVSRLFSHLLKPM